MQYWIHFAKGPLFVFSFSFMIFGLLRHVVITLWDIRQILHDAGDKNLPYQQIIKATLSWLIPTSQLRHRIFYSLTSFLFHIAVIIVPLFLAGHISLWLRGTGISWPAVPNKIADILTIIGIITAIALVFQRFFSGPTRALSRTQDYFIPLLLAVPFASGFFLMHPIINPFSYEAMFLLHVISANIIFILVPITKLSHMILLPSVQLVSELGWRWPADAGHRVAVALKKEDEAI